MYVQAHITIGKKIKMKIKRTRQLHSHLHTILPSRPRSRNLYPAWEKVQGQE